MIAHRYRSVTAYYRQRRKWVLILTVALVAALGHLNRPDEARSAVAELLRKRPGFSCSFAKDHLFYVKDSAQIQHYVDGLHKAGVPG